MDIVDSTARTIAPEIEFLKRSGVFLFILTHFEGFCKKTLQVARETVRSPIQDFGRARISITLKMGRIGIAYFIRAPSFVSAEKSGGFSMQALISYPLACWTILVQIAPALLLGFVAAGIISAFLSEAFVKRHLGGGGLWPVVKGGPHRCSDAALLLRRSARGDALKRSGASRGALVAFLISVPQTGADNMLVVWSMLGALFSIYSPISAFLSGIFGGTLCQLFGEEHGERRKTAEALAKESRRPPPRTQGHPRILLTTLVDEIAGALVVGILIAAAISILIPDGWMARYLGPGAGSMLLMLVVAFPYTSAPPGRFR
jgi:uncharacterized membrane protein YraQ (UPF0718 family)